MRASPHFQLNRRTRSELWLVLCTLLYGTTFVLVQRVITTIEPFWLIAIRFTLMTLLITPFILGALKRMTRSSFWQGSLLGWLMCAGFMLQTFGLRHTSATKSAFITGTLVVLTPFVERALALTRISWSHWLGVASSTLGLYFLTMPTGATALSLNRGDLMTLGAALCFSLYIVSLGTFAGRSQASTSEKARADHLWNLIFLQSAWAGFWGIALALIFRAPLPLHATPFQWVIVLYLSIGTTLLTFWIQTRFQADTSASRAALIFSLEPMFALSFAIVLQDEVPTRRALLGAGIIMLGVLFAQIPSHFARRLRALLN